MKKNEPKIDWELVNSIIHTPKIVDQRPQGEGWFTSSEYADANGIGRPHASEKLREAYMRGALERGGTKGRWYYRVKQ